MERTLREWAYAPKDRADFALNVLSRRVASARDRDPSARDDEAARRRVFASVCAVPAGAQIEYVADLSDLADQMKPNLHQYEPPGVWLPTDPARFLADGVYLRDEDYGSNQAPRGWSRYIYASRHGYIEYGRQGGFPYRGRNWYQFAPTVAWIQRFTRFVTTLRAQFFDGADYWLVANFADTQDAVLCALDDDWRQPQDWDRDTLERWSCLETSVQISMHLSGESAGDVARWFAERIAHAFGLAEARSYNKDGVLPVRKLEFS